MAVVDVQTLEAAGPAGPGGPEYPDAAGAALGPPAPNGSRLWGVVFEVGLTFIMLGVVVLLFAAYQLWGTGVAEARSQHRLASEFSKSLSQPAPTTTVPTHTTTPPTTAPPTRTARSSDSSTITSPAAVSANIGPIPEGQAIGWIDIPKIGVHQIFVQGVADSDLQEGPGHYPGTPYPGEAGNAAIAGHRTTYGAPFYSVNDLNPGDQIIATTRAGRFVYLVTKLQIVKPNDTQVLNPSLDNQLTLTTCNPRYLSYQRLVVVAVLQRNTVVAPPAAQVVPAQPPKSGSGEDAVVTPPSTASGARITTSPALNGTKDAWPPTILWGALFAGIWVLSRVGFRKWRPRWAFVAAGIPLCLIVLWPFFENVSRLLPSNI